MKERFTTDVTIPKSGRDCYEQGLTGQQFQRTPVIGAIDVFPDSPDTKFMSFQLGQRCTINGRITNTSDTTISFIDSFNVTRPLRGRGLGRRLLEAFITQSQAEGATELWSKSVSNMALRLRAKVLGEKSLIFYDSDHPLIGALPMTLSQAMMTNDRIDHLDQKAPERQNPESHIGVFVDLSQLDSSRWERAERVTRYGLDTENIENAMLQLNSRRS